MRTLTEAYRNVRESQSDMLPNLDALELHVAASCWTAAPPGEGADVVELGVRNGTSTIALLHALVGRGDLWSIDKDQPSGPLVNAAFAQGHWNFYRSDSVDDRALAWAPDEVACVFIDTWHTYDVTLEELEAWWPRVQPGGCVLLHDTKLKTVEGQDDWPVTRAARRFAEFNGLAFDFASRAGYGLGVVHADPT